MINKNTFHICHHCLEASSNYRGDINRHLKKKINVINIQIYLILKNQ